MNKILFLSFYGRRGASSRERFWNLSDFCNSKNIKSNVSSLLNDTSVENFHNGIKRSKFVFIKALLKRICILMFSFNNDYIVIEKTLFPYLGILLTPLLYLHIIFFKTRIIFDFDDAVNLIYKLDIPFSEISLNLIEYEINILPSIYTLGTPFLKDILNIRKNYYYYPTPVPGFSGNKVIKY